MQYKIKLINEKILEFKKLRDLKKFTYYRDLYEELVGTTNQDQKQVLVDEFVRHLKLMSNKKIEINETDSHWLYASAFVHQDIRYKEEKSKKRSDSLDHFSHYSDFDRGVVLRSLKCILYNECPVNSEKYEILNHCNGLKY